MYMYIHDMYMWSNLHVELDEIFSSFSSTVSKIGRIFNTNFTQFLETLTVRGVARVNYEIPRLSGVPKILTASLVQVGDVKCVTAVRELKIP